MTSVTSRVLKNALHDSTRSYSPVLIGALATGDGTTGVTSSPEGAKSLAMLSRAAHPDSSSAQETSAAVAQFLLVLTIYFPHVIGSEKCVRSHSPASLAAPPQQKANRCRRDERGSGTRRRADRPDTHSTPRSPE